MVEIDKSPEKTITIDQLKSRYSLEEKFKKELDDMDFMDRIKHKDGFYMNTKKGLAHARVMEYLRKFLNIGGHQ